MDRGRGVERGLEVKRGKERVGARPLFCDFEKRRADCLHTIRYSHLELANISKASVPPDANRQEPQRLNLQVAGFD